MHSIERIFQGFGSPCHTSVDLAGVKQGQQSVESCHDYVNAVVLQQFPPAVTTGRPKLIGLPPECTKCPFLGGSTLAEAPASCDLWGSSVPFTVHSAPELKRIPSSFDSGEDRSFKWAVVLKLNTSYPVGESISLQLEPWYPTEKMPSTSWLSFPHKLSDDRIPDTVIQLFSCTSADLFRKASDTAHLNFYLRIKETTGGSVNRTFLLMNPLRVSFERLLSLTAPRNQVEPVWIDMDMFAIVYPVVKRWCISSDRSSDESFHRLRHVFHFKLGLVDCPVLDQWKWIVSGPLSAVATCAFRGDVPHPQGTLRLEARSR